MRKVSLFPTQLQRWELYINYDAEKPGNSTWLATYTDEFTARRHGYLIDRLQRYTDISPARSVQLVNGIADLSRAISRETMDALVNETANRKLKMLRGNLHIIFIWLSVLTFGGAYLAMRLAEL